MAPAYVLPLLLVLFLDVALDAQRRRLRWTTMLLPAVVVLLVAGPWWLVSGHAALHYLFSAGYNTSTGYSSQSGGLSPSSIYDHITWFLDELAWPQSVALGVVVVSSVWAVAHFRRRLHYGGLWLLVAWILLTVLVLSSTGDNGSGFGVPVVAMTILASGAVLGQCLYFSVQRRWAATMVVALGAVLLIGVLAEGTGRTSLWWKGPPYRVQVLSDGGNWDTNLDSFAASVSHLIGREPTLDALNTGLLNSNGLVWTVRQGELNLTAPNTTQDAIASLAKSKFVISGSTYLQYPPPVDERTLELAAEARHFRPVRVWTFGSFTTIVLWEHSPPAGASNLLTPEVTVTKPVAGSVLSGDQFLAARVSGPAAIPVPVSKVEFFVSGEGLQDASVGEGTTLGPSFAYAWLGAWNTSRFPDGRYVVTAVAISDGQAIRSGGVAVQVRHGASATTRP
jgi:hypothetical protein